MSSLFQACENGSYNICNICNAKIKNRQNGGKWNLSRHMRLKHPSIGPIPSAISQPVCLSTPCSVVQSNKITPDDMLNFTKKGVSPVMSNNPEVINVDSEALKLIHPFSLIISGPTSSGKSTLLFQILENLHENTKPEIQKVVYIYGVYQEAFENYPNIFFTDDLDYMDVKSDVPTVIVLDDVMSSINNSNKL